MNLLIFDMDGTITPSRKKIDPEMAVLLTQILQFDKIIIVSGSDIDYMNEQLNILFKTIPKNNCWKFSLMPCNGTKEYHMESGVVYKSSELEKNMIDEIGVEDYRKLIRIIFQTHVSALNDSGLVKGLPITGTFLQYRNTTLNYCPIGRDSEFSNREKFIELDKKFYIREQILYQLEQSFYMMGLNNQIEVVLGGQTSLDIYPRGWDKTLALNKVNPMSFNKILFFGDHCDKNQNDHSIYKAVGNLHNGKSYWVKSEKETVAILESYFNETYKKKSKNYVEN